MLDEPLDSHTFGTALGHVWVVWDVFGPCWDVGVHFGEMFGAISGGA